MSTLPVSKTPLTKQHTYKTLADPYYIHIIDTDYNYL